MNNYPPIFYQLNNNYDFMYELSRIKEEINKINKRLDNLENNKNNDYMKKNDEYYII